MPYIIKTIAPCFPQEAGHRVSRRAVATLDEAREAAAKAVDRAEPFGGAPYGVWAGCRDDQAKRLPEDGGTIVCPDNTVIEVERVGLNELRIGQDTLHMSRDELIAFYNAKQETT